MKNKTPLIKFLVLAFAFALSACQKSEADSINVSPSAISPVPSANLKPVLNANFPIRKVDFKNFKYPLVYMDDSGFRFFEIETGKEAEFFELRDGEQKQTEEEDGAIIQDIKYGDVTGDGNDEAIISVLPVTGGNCSCDMVYVYAVAAEKPILLWAFGTGDRADGGLKKIYTEKGGLIIETFGDNKFEDDKWEFSFPKGKFSGYCCPMAYTKIRFKWNGEKFAAEGEPELFDYDWKKEMNNSR